MILNLDREAGEMGCPEVRRALKRVADGESYRAIARDLSNLTSVESSASALAQAWFSSSTGPRGSMMATNSEKTFMTPSSAAVAAARKADHEILTQIDGVGDELATKLLDRFGSLHGVQQAAARQRESLTEIKGINEAAAVEFHGRMLEAGVQEKEPSADAVRRGHRAKVYHRADQNHQGEFEVVDVGQEVAGIAVPSLFLKLNPIGDAYGRSSSHKSGST